MFRKFGSWLWWKKPSVSADGENSPATSSLDGSFGGSNSPMLDSGGMSDGRRPASPRGRPGSPNNRPLVLHWIFSASCGDGTILPDGGNPDRWNWIEAEVVRRFASERCDCQGAISTHQHSLSSPRRGAARPELPPIVLELGEQDRHGTGVIDTLAAADLIEEWVRAFRTRPEAIVCYCTYPASAITAGRPSQDYSDFFRFPAKVLEELRLRATLPWAEHGHEIVFLYSSNGAPRAMTDFILHRSPERIITAPHADPSTVLGHHKMVAPLTVSPASQQPPSHSFGGSTAASLDFRPLAAFVAIDCDEPYQSAHLQTTKSVSPGSSPTATSLDAALVDQGMVLLQAAAVSLYEDIRDTLFTHHKELGELRKGVASSLTAPGTFAHQHQSDVTHTLGASEPTDFLEMQPQRLGKESSASIELGSPSCVSLHLLKDLPTVTLKTLEVILKNLSPLLSKDRERYLVLNHTSDRFQNVVGQYPLAMAVLANVGFMNAEYMDEGGPATVGSGSGTLSPRLSPSSPMHRMALPKALLSFFTPEIERTLRATQAEVDRRESAKNRPSP